MRKRVAIAALSLTIGMGSVAGMVPVTAFATEQTTEAASETKRKLAYQDADGKMNGRYYSSDETVKVPDQADKDGARFLGWYNDGWGGSTEKGFIKKGFVISPENTGDYWLTPVWEGDDLAQSLNVTYESEYGSLEDESNKIVTYLSDIGWKSGYAMHGGIRKKHFSGSVPAVLVNGERVENEKGLVMHADAEAVFDISAYGATKFKTRFGIDPAGGENGNDGVEFKISVSSDGKTYKELVKQTLMQKADSVEVDLDITGMNYIKLNCGKVGNTKSDHSTFLDPRIVSDIKSGFDMGFVKPVETLNSELSSVKSVDDMTAEQKNADFMRMVVRKAGYDNIRTASNASAEANEAISYLFNDKETLELFATGGNPSGSWANFFKEWTKLYTTYKSDLTGQNASVYKKLMLATALTHSTHVGFWLQPNAYSNSSVSEERYKFFRDSYANDTFNLVNMDYKNYFKNYSVEEMRYLTSNGIDDEDLAWLQDYVRRSQTGNKVKKSAWMLINPTTYVNYKWTNIDAKYYENVDTWNAKQKSKERDIYLLGGIYLGSQGTTIAPYNFKGKVTYQKGVHKLWMLMEAGAVCGGISKTGTNLKTAFGIPSRTICQPGHCAYIYLTRDNQGRGVWNRDYSLAGWNQSGKEGSMEKRVAFGWEAPDASWASSYYVIAQEALNDFENMKKSMLSAELADAKQGADKEEALLAAIKYEKVNLDAYKALNAYYTQTKAGEDKFLALQKLAADNLKYHPLAMCHIMNDVQKHLTGANLNQAKIYRLDALNAASKATSRETLQPDVAKDLAPGLKGNLEKEIADFKASKAAEQTKDSQAEGEEANGTQDADVVQ